MPILQPNYWLDLKSFYLTQGRIVAKPYTHIQVDCRHSQSGHPLVNQAVPLHLAHAAGTALQNQEYSMDQPMLHNQSHEGEDL